MPGLIDRLTTHRLPEAAAALEMSATGRRVTAVALPFHLGGITWQAPSAANRPDLRAQLAALTEHLAEDGTGLLITVDELHRADRAGLRELVATVQHGFREELPVAFAGAGLLAAIADLLNDDVLTFLRRADRYHLGDVDPADVADALRAPIAASGYTITDSALEVATAGAGGYPFLIQLVGFWICKLGYPAGANPGKERVIDEAVAATGVQAARRRLGSLIHEPALQDLSPVDRTFLAAMAVDDGPSRMADVASRLGADVNYASQYRLRLIAADMIRPSGRGRVDFRLPYLRDYLGEHAAIIGR